jgi:hypothetical protein
LIVLFFEIQANPGTEGRRLYDEGVQFGCWGMALYSLSCSIYSLGIESLVKRFRAKRVYIGGQLVYSIGMFFNTNSKRARNNLFCAHATSRDALTFLIIIPFRFVSIATLLTLTTEHRGR